MSKLTYRNNWEYDEYYVDGKKVTSLKRVRAGNMIYPVTTREISVPYSDHGITHHTTSPHHFVRTFVLGVQKEIDLNTIVPHTDVYAVEYDVE